MVLDVDLLQTLQGVASGGRNDVATYWGTAEYTLNVDTQKLGLWPGGSLRVQGLSSFGQNINHATGAIISPNFPSLLPEPEHSTTGLMNLTFMQFLSKHFGVFLSKVSGLGADDNAFAHGYHTTFLNSGLALNVTLALFPLTACGGGLVILPWDGAVVTVAALDPSETATDNDIGDAFEDGVLVFALLVPTQPPNRVGYTWSVYYNFDQYLWSPEGAPDGGISVFFRFGASDGVANPIKYVYNVGIGAKGLVPGRPCNNFGMGWARTELSDNFVPLLRQRLRLGLGHEDAIELYYNVAITPWLNAALDLQIIDQALEKRLDASRNALRDLPTAVVLGLRVYARF